MKQAALSHEAGLVVKIVVNTSGYISDSPGDLDLNADFQVPPQTESDLHSLRD